MNAEEFDAMDGMEEGMKDIRSSSSGDDKGSDGDDVLPPSNSRARKRKSPSGAEKTSLTSDGANKLSEDGSCKVAPRKAKKLREELDELHAETQRLLRETPGASFAPEQATTKPVSSLIEKIRQRKLQLSNSLAKGSTLTQGRVSTQGQRYILDDGAVDDEIEFVMSKPPIRLVVKEEPGGPSTVPRDEPDENPVRVDDIDNAGDGAGSQPSTPDIRLDRSNSNPGYKSPSKSSSRAPLLESQDLYSDSQLSLKDDSPVLGDDEDIIPVGGRRMNLHFDTETQDDDRWLEEDIEKENRDPSVISLSQHIPIVADVRGLVDDEAEDEDEEDNSLGDEDDEGQETAGELQDLVTQDAGEKLADVERRAELHSKWLEQQDLAMEDNILHRIETRWKIKGKEIPALLSDSRDRGSKREDVATPSKGILRLGEPASGAFGSNFEALSKQVKEDERRLERATSSGSMDQDRADLMQQDNNLESSDDEEAEENLRRQIFLHESEEKIEFLSVADDESSREILGLINKVNVAAIKPRTTTAHNEARYHQPPSLQHQASFLRRKVTTVSATTRQGSGSSRSYVFGRDDSNSRDSKDASRLDTTEQTGRAKVPDEPKASSAPQSTQMGASSRPKSSLPKDTKPGQPSLFQVLKQQAAELASGKTPLDFSGSSSRGDNLSIFLPMKPSRQPKGSRGR